MKRWQSDDSAFWISYSDLATGLLLIFVLLLTESSRSKLVEQEVMKERNATLLKLQSEVARLIGVHAKLSERLRIAVQRSNSQLEKPIFQFLDDEVYVSDQEMAWFKSNSSKLLPEAEQQIRVFYLNLYDALLKDSDGKPSIEDHLSSMTIEGHTDPLPIRASSDKLWSLTSYNGTRGTNYLSDSNFQLGQQRAKAIVDLIHESYELKIKGFDNTRPWHVFFSLVQASGRSWTRAYCKQGDKVSDKPLTPIEIVAHWPSPCSDVVLSSDAIANRRSRRVTFSFELDTRTLLNRLKFMLDQHISEESK